MGSSRTVFFVIGDPYLSGPSRDLSSALSKIDCHLLITDISGFHAMAARYSPLLVIATLPGTPESDLKFCRILLKMLIIPVIVIGSMDNCSCRIAALEAGVTDFLVSPVNSLELTARVRNILHRQPQLVVQ